MKDSSLGAKMYFVILALLVVGLLFGNVPWESDESLPIDNGDTAWMLVASAFVLLMTPGLAFFYGGMVNMKSIISTMLQSFVALGIISVLWVIVGFSLSFGESIYGVVGNPFTHFNFKDCLLYTSPSPRDKRQSRMPSSA